MPPPPFWTCPQACSPGNKSEDDPRILKLPEGTIEAARASGYNNVLKVGELSSVEATTHTLGWFALLSWLCTPPGLAFVFTSVHRVTGGFAVSGDDVRQSPLFVWTISSVIMSFFSIVTFLPLAMYYDSLYVKEPGQRCQTKRTHDNSGLWRRSEVRLATLNLAVASVVTSGVCVVHNVYKMDKLYFDVPTNVMEFVYVALSAIFFFIWIDLMAYVVHRFLHLPFMYRNVHKWHHKYVQPTAFSALGLHPLEMFMLQSTIYSAFYFMPLHPAAIISNLLYVHFHNVVDHSGVYAESPMPWQPSSLFHDDHHRFFHVNYGQTFTLWDKLGGTFFRPNKKYSASSFSW